MKLCELSEGYNEAAQRLRVRLTFLRRKRAGEKDPARREALKSEIKALAKILTQCNDLAELTTHYYERGYSRNAKYTL